MLSRKQDIDTITMQELQKFDQSTHNHAASCSVGTAIKYLFTYYFGQKKDPEACINVHYHQCLEEIKAQAAEDSAAACDYLDKLAQQPINQLDYLSLYFEKGNSESYVFPLKQVITLVWIALTDDQQYACHIPEEDPEKRALAFLRHRKDRLKSFYRCINGLHRNTICHHGNRNELVFLLNKSFPGIDLLEDGKSTVLYFLKEQLLKRFMEQFEGADFKEKEILTKAAISWIMQHNPEELLAVIDPKQEIYKDLTALFIKHGVDPKIAGLKKLLKDVLPSLSFSCSPDTDETLYIIHRLFQYPEDDFLRYIRAWIQQNLVLQNMNHREGLKTFYTFYEAFHALQKNHYLFSITRFLTPTILELEKLLQAYFSNVLETGALELRAEDEEMFAMIDTLMQSIQQAKAAKLPDEIENFFIHWFLAEGDQETRAKSYKLLLSKHFQEVALLSDEAIEDIFASSTDGVLSLTPYLINRIFLQAILIPVNQWSLAFGGDNPNKPSERPGIFPMVLDFAKSKFSNSQTLTAVNLKGHSYPTILLSQLDYLYEKYLNFVFADLGIENQLSLERPQNMIMLPGQVTTCAEWREIACLLKIISNEAFTAYYQIYRVKVEAILVKAILNKQDSMEHTYLSIPDSIPESFRIRFIHGLLQKKTLINGKMLANFVLFIREANDEECLEEAVQYFLSIHKSGNHLSSFFNSFPAEKHIYIVKTLGSKAIDFREDPLTLANILAAMEDDKAREELIDSLKDIYDILRFSYGGFSSIVAVLSPKLQLHFIQLCMQQIKPLRCSVILYAAYLSLSQMDAHEPIEELLAFILVNIDKFDEYFFDKFIDKLPNFLQIRLIKGAERKIHCFLKYPGAPEKLAKLLSLLENDADRLECIEHFGNRIFDRCNFGADPLCILLETLSEENRLPYLKTLFRRNPVQTRIFLLMDSSYSYNITHQKPRELMAGILSNQKLAFLAFLIKETGYSKQWRDLAPLITEFPLLEKLAVLDLMAEHLGKITRYELNNVLNSFPGNERIQVLTKLDALGYLHRKEFQWPAVFSAFDEKDHVFLLQTYREQINATLGERKALCNILKDLNADNQLSLMEPLVPNLLTMLSDAYNFIEILDALKGEDLHNMLLPYCKNFGTFGYLTGYLHRLFNYFTEKRHAQLIQTVDLKLISTFLELSALAKILTPVNRILLIQQLGSGINRLISNPTFLSDVVGWAPELGPKIIQNYLAATKDDIELKLPLTILLGFPNSDETQLEMIKTLRNSIRRQILSKEITIYTLLLTANKANRLALIQCLGEEINQIIHTDEDLNKILSYLPEQDKLALLPFKEEGYNSYQFFKQVMNGTEDKAITEKPGLSTG